ncbi:MAG: UDP-N-acetylglucosamine 1-carboxyvinyltransferase [Candidatus Magasanikbacteria bacterium]
MSTFFIKGGKKLKGEIPVSAGKNAPVALLCAALLIKGQITLKNMTRGQEVQRVLEILESIGVQIGWNSETELILEVPDTLNIKNIDRHACEVTRISILLFGALAAREKKFKIYKAGGCKLGNRTVRPHTLALEKLGVHVDSHDDYYEVQTKKLKGAKVVMYEAGDTPTENIIIAAALAEGETVIKFASANYMVQQVCYFLEAAGAKIEGIGNTTLKIIGVKSLKTNVEYAVSPDPVDAMAWIALGITTKSPLNIIGCPIDFLELELEKLSVMGQKFQLKNDRFAENGKTPLVDIEIIPSDLVALPDKLAPQPFPGINIDNVPLFIPILTQAEGRTLVHDWIYENRAIYYLEFQKLGANVLLLDPHRVMIEGSTKLKANEVICPPAIRPGMALLIAMIAAEGESILRNTYPIERAYDGLLERLHGVGADIRRGEES